MKTLEEAALEAASEYGIYVRGSAALPVEDVIEEAFTMGAEWADSWYSVEDELPELASYEGKCTIEVLVITKKGVTTVGKYCIDPNYILPDRWITHKPLVEGDCVRFWRYIKLNV